MLLRKTVEKTRDVPLSDAEIKEIEEKEAKEKLEREEKGEKAEEPKEPAPRTKKETYKESNFQQVNSSKPLWLRDPKDITADEYKSF